MNKKIFYILGFLFLPFLTYAHVSYVIPKQDFDAHMGPDSEYIINTISNSQFAIIGIASIVGLILLIYISKKVKFVNRKINKIEQKLASYHEFIPWIARLALGIGLLGAGVEGVLLSPTLSEMSTFSFIQTLLGFFFLMGFMLTPTILITIGLYFFALTKSFYMIGNLDILALCLALLVFHSARPGVDDILGTSWLRFLKVNRNLLAPIVRVGVGSAMLFLALYEKIFNPYVSELVVYKFDLMSIIPVSANMWVVGTGVVEAVLGILLILGLYTRLTSIVSIFVLSLTFFYFKEAVYSHVTLFSILAITAIEGGGLASVDSLRKNIRFNLFKKSEQVV